MTAPETPKKESEPSTATSKPRKKLFRRSMRWFLFVVWVVVVTAVLLEVAVRWWGYSEHYLYDPIYQPCAESAEIPFVHKPNLSGAKGRGLTGVHTDELGLRCSAGDDTPATKPAGEVRVAVLGDSVTFGEGVKDNDETFCRVLQNVLNTASGIDRYRVYNFGVSAYSVKDMYNTLVHRAVLVQPDIVLMAVVPEDFDLARTPQVDAYGYTYNAQLSGDLSRDSRLKRALRNVHSVYWLRDLLWRWRHRNDPPAGGVNELPTSYPYIKKFHDFARKQDWRSAVVLLPSQASSFSPALRRQLREDGVEVIDLTGLAEKFTPDEFQASRFDRHPSAAVHGAIGIALAKWLSSP
ncbi:MAG: SGNH/GDSL hydrolase family protein [Phycisphaerae bacterium]|nr:SGNH/GDSL hydrolase family protein [Phycisphaerae bacterium]